MALHLSAGEVFANDYRVVGPLASGGMGAVYVVSQLSTGERRALKVMRAGLDDPASRARFDREARISALVPSAHVVKVVQAGIDEASGVPWLCMELLEGEDLAARVARAPLSVAEVAVLLEQVCHALALAHDLPVVHRDLKPENLYLARPQSPGVPFTVKILDFGIAKVASGPSALAKTASVGTPLWMAPEQADAEPAITPATDVWALGLIAFHALTGKMYWRSANVASPQVTAVFAEVLSSPIAPAGARADELGAPRLPDGFDAWFARCVARAPGERFAHAREVAASFADVARGATSLGLSATMPMPSSSSRAAAAPAATGPAASATAPGRRGPPVAWLVGASVALVAGAAGWSLWQARVRREAEAAALAASARAAEANRERARLLRGRAASDSLGADKSACLAMLDEADALDPSNVELTPADVRARCEMAAGRCAQGKRRYRDFIKHDPRVPPISVEAMVRTTASQSCPVEQLDLGERMALVSAQVANAWSAGDAAACEAGAARAIALLAELPKDGADETARNTGLSTLQQAAGCVARAGRCDDGKLLHRRYHALAPYLAAMPVAQADDGFFAQNPQCAPKR